ncbi:hypothetical protein DRP53_06745 [candidate division WOR-3 bacterium]|uniref:Uncharacterized protein n=1 Tax=candidate division WOR-3 bacterium TaxID=2052148 RepID=A0A660SIV5_UNCW3|nr:MAG: hypothetical protein DRP53_06745 [candidate division WOR-3 bacterium]
MLILLFSLLVETHGRGYIAKYIPDDSLYNSDAAVEVYCDLFQFKALRFFIDYRNELYMGKQPDKAISLDPRLVHYYLTPGFTFDIGDLILTACIVHDCIHDIDVENPGTPVFNRFRLLLEPAAFHLRNRGRDHNSRPLWRLMIGSYPQFPSIYAWTNWGADYKYEIKLDLLLPIIARSGFRFGLLFSSHAIRRKERNFYQRHVIRTELALYGRRGAFVPFLSYFLYSDDPLKNPDRMSILGIEVIF